MDISVIIPVYNVENYLRRCIDSVLIQKNVSFEVILVDDGSTDQCPEICDEYSKKDDRILVIHKRNEGLGFARNSGIDIAKGDYIFFLDSDDWIPQGTLKSLRELADKYKVDIISFNYIQTQEIGYIQVKNEDEKVIKLSSKSDIMKEYLDGQISTTACSKLYRKEIFNHIRFTNIILHEDAYSMHLFLNEANSLLITNQIYYIQYVRCGSLMQSIFSDKNFISLECGKRLVEFVDEMYPLYHYKALEILLRRKMDILIKIIRDGVYKKYRKQYLEIYNAIKKEIKSFSYESFDNKSLYKQITRLVKYPIFFIVIEKMRKIKGNLSKLIHKVV